MREGPRRCETVGGELPHDVSEDDTPAGESVSGCLHAAVYWVLTGCFELAEPLFRCHLVEVAISLSLFVS